jgi:serine/threonine-protein kinase
MAERLFLGKYQPLRHLADGGMSRLYLARALHQDRQVVVKVMHDHLKKNDNALKSFQREIQVLRQVCHPNAVEFLDASLDDPNGPLLVMEYVQGITFSALLRQNGRLTPQRTAYFLEQLCSLLTHIHEQGIIHRDLKPGNLMVLHAETAHAVLKVMDFGLAQFISCFYLAPEAVEEPNRKTVPGTPQYLCPELIRGAAVDHRGDLYSLGVILFEALTGRRPFEVTDLKGMFEAHEKQPPPTFATVGAPRSIPPATEALVQACLAKMPADRPQSAAELFERFRDALGQPRSASNAVSPTGSSARYTPLSGVQQGSSARYRPLTALQQGSSARHIPLSVANAQRREDDPDARTYHLEVAMIEAMVVVKLRGFFHDLGGKVVESVPGMILFHKEEGAKPAASEARGPRSWFGFGQTRTAAVPRLIEMQLLMVPKDEGQSNRLTLTLVIREKGSHDPNRMQWQTRCDAIFRDLKAYLFSAGGSA